MITKKLLVLIGVEALLFYLFNKCIRKWLGLGKAPRRNVFYKPYAILVNLIMSLVFLILTLRVGSDSPYIFVFFFLYTVVLFGFEVILQKKYLDNSKEYIATIFSGLILAVLMMILMIAVKFYGF
ncbi:DUF4181 domain-containing protein [Bacillus sp. JJ722]|uniref:DUF4181 domain-containing protein n=1 Tax=Bacillus sp. JJ722 TaxID=3122973 RepID=UPI003F68A7B4